MNERQCNRGLGSSVVLATSLVGSALLAISALASCSLDADPLMEAERIVRTRAAALGASGMAVGVFDEDGLLWRTNYGWEDQAAGLPVDGDTRFYVASVSKLVSALAACKLAESGAIAFGEDVNAYLPFDVRHPSAPDTPITVDMLLSHSSGIVDDWGTLDGVFQAVEPFASAPPSMAKAMRGYLSPGGDWYSASNFGGLPGERIEYSNVGMTLVALIVQEVTGKDFASYCTDELFDPLGLSCAWHTGSPAPDCYRIAAPTADGTRYPHRASSLYPAGFLVCTLDDLVALMTVFVSGGLSRGKRLLRSETVESVFVKVNNRYFRAWAESGFTVDGERIAFHLGGFAGVRTGVYLSRRDGVGAIILATGAYDFPYAHYELASTLLELGRKLK